jgi:hypothetical protein
MIGFYFLFNFAHTGGNESTTQVRGRMGGWGLREKEEKLSNTTTNNTHTHTHKEDKKTSQDTADRPRPDFRPFPIDLVPRYCFSNEG